MVGGWCKVQSCRTDGQAGADLAIRAAYRGCHDAQRRKGGCQAAAKRGGASQEPWCGSLVGVAANVANGEWQDAEGAGGEAGGQAGEEHDGIGRDADACRSWCGWCVGAWRTCELGLHLVVDELVEAVDGQGRECVWGGAWRMWIVMYEMART